MGTNYQRFLRILSKWPPKQELERMDYGAFLRNLLKNKAPTENIFPGDSMENSLKLDSLNRLLNNTYGKKYPCHKTKGAGNLDMKSLQHILKTNVIEDVKKPKMTSKNERD